MNCIHDPARGCKAVVINTCVHILTGIANSQSGQFPHLLSLASRQPLLLATGLGYTHSSNQEYSVAGHPYRDSLVKFV